MDIEIKLSKEVNFDALDHAIRNRFGNRVAGITLREDGMLLVHVLEPREGDERAVDEVLEQHDPTTLAPEQEKRAADHAAVEELKEMLDSQIDWHKENPVTTQNAVEVLRRMQVEWVYLLRLLRSGRL